LRGQVWGGEREANASESFCEFRLCRHAEFTFDGGVLHSPMADDSVAFVGDLEEDEGKVPVKCGAGSTEVAAFEGGEAAPTDEMATELNSMLAAEVLEQRDQHCNCD